MIERMFKAAGPAEIVRSHQKDDFYLGYLRKTAADVVHALIGRDPMFFLVLLNIIVLKIAKTQLYINIKRLCHSECIRGKNQFKPL